MEEYMSNLGEWVIGTGLRIVLIGFLTIIAMKVASLVADRLFAFLTKSSDKIEAKKRADTLKSIVLNTLKILIFAISLMMILKELGIEIGPILAAAGVVGLAVGFGAQKLVEDVLSGFFILIEDQIRVGDVVQIAGVGGLVEKITLRMVILRDLGGNVHFVRNGQINIVTNMTKEYSRYVFDIGVAYREDVDEVIEIIKKVDEDMRNDEIFKSDILAPMEILGLDKFGDSAIVIKTRTMTRPIKQWGVAREFNKRLKKAFDENNIEIPFPHRTLYFGVDKDGSSPEARVALKPEKK